MGQVAGVEIVEIGFGDAKKLGNVAGQLVTLHGGGKVLTAARELKLSARVLGRLLAARTGTRYTKTMLDEVAQAAGFPGVDALLAAKVLPNLARPTEPKMFVTRATVNRATCR